MKFNIKSIISCFFLFLYLLVGLFGSGSVSVCHGSEHSRHIGVNILGYEPCCKYEKAKENSSFIKKNKNTISNKCECDDQTVKVGNISQNVHSSDYTNDLFESIKIINTHIISSIKLGFNETYNKIDWNIYRYRDRGSYLVTLDTIILQI